MMDLRLISKNDTEKLSVFFSEIYSDSIIKKFFHPHQFTEEEARKICNELSQKKDLYFIALKKEKVVGYGMLRGWDEGYDIPSFGICVHPNYQGQGIGKAITCYAIKLSKEKKAEKIMLKVYKENIPAYELYKKIGFDFTGETEDKKQWVGYLKI